MLPLAAGTGWGLAGNTRSKLVIGASVTLLKMLDVIPFFMCVYPTRISVIPSPWRTISRSGNAAPALETK